MSYSLTGTLRILSDLTFSNVLDLSTVPDRLQLNWNQTIINGSGIDSSQVLWHDTRTIGATANETLDLVGTLACAFGIVTFTRVKGILIENITEDPTALLTAGNAASGFTSMFGATDDTLIIQPGGMLALTAPSASGYVVTAGSAHLLKLANSSTTTPITYNIAIWGEGTVTP